MDVSGGAGRWLSTLAPHFSHFSHFDLSPDALYTAQADQPDFPNVEFGRIDLLKSQAEQPSLRGRAWDVAFCLDTLLYRGRFVEIALRSIRSYLAPGGIAIIDLPVEFRSSLSRRVKGSRYGGPQRAFLPRRALSMANAAGYECVATAYQYRELPVSLHRFFAERNLTHLLPWPATWMCMVLINPSADQRLLSPVPQRRSA
jgi:SAM-dependent methyltransferase